MARISREKWQENLETYNALILKIFLDEGWDHVTYDRLSKETGLRKSTLQGYYPSNKEFENAINGKILPIVLQHLSFESKDKLVDSWRESLSSKQFRMIMRMFVMHASKSGEEGSGKLGVQGLISLVQHKLPEEDALLLVQHLFGLTITELFGIR
ncbi:hypothetical protein D0812_24210 [Vibrio owensii]|uniref:TetR/AcrR family transcriptional regulator n=1 Tax=Vibrio owensii TaxID=696485 RepID=A0AAP9KCC3_9VIBR|nr:hypothetical protein [Vibrio owensii]AYO17471.1 hypothetical protein D0812_24210 [Vibrio owensii]QGH49613.1 hypothetical protein APZ19_21200 [Vibrio owensii]